MADQGFVAATRCWKIPPLAEGIRLDAFVRRCLPHLSEREARRAIEEGAFWVDDRRAKKGDRLFTGSVLRLRGFSHLLAQSPVPARHRKVSILYEDDCLIALDKPPGMPTHGFSGRDADTLANVLAAIRPSLVGIGANRWEVGLVHRLDRDTSGIVLAAKDQNTFDCLRAAFRRGAVGKVYWALVWGRTRSEGFIDAALLHDPGDRRKMKSSVEAKKRARTARTWPARTRFKRLAHARGFSLLEIEIGTGVTHQIRVHLSSIGHPLVGDSLYAPDHRDWLGLGRMFLHALSLRFLHPRSDQELILESPLAGDLREVVSGLGIRL